MFLVFLVCMFLVVCMHNYPPMKHPRWRNSNAQSEAACLSLQVGQRVGIVFLLSLSEYESEIVYYDVSESMR